MILREPHECLVLISCRMWVWILLAYTPLSGAALGEPPRVSPTSPVHFPLTGAAFLSYREWLLITTINLEPYENLLHQMENEIDDFARAVDTLNDEYQETIRQSKTDPPTTPRKGKGTLPSQTTWSEDLFSLAHSQTNHLSEELANLRALYEGIRVSFLKQPGPDEETFTDIPSRPTRALVPDWISSFLGYTTGLTTRAQTDLLRRQIRVLSEENKVIATAARHGLTLLNTTTQEVARNRDAINHLAEAVENMHQQFVDLQDILAGQVTGRIAMTMGMDALLLSLTAASSLVRRAHTELLILRSQLQSAASGNYPWDMLSPAEVESFADHLRESLPHSYVLPYKTDQLHRLLHTLPAVVVSNTTTVHVALRFPLSEQEEYYDIHRVASVPYYADPSNTTILQYDLEADAIAITKDRSRYRPLSLAEAKPCEPPAVTHCPTAGPAYDTNNAPLCVTSLLIQDQGNAKRLCHLRTRPAPAAPVVRPLGQSNWLMFSPHSLHMTLSCAPQVQPAKDHVTIPTGTSLVVLPDGCKATSSVVNLPAHSRQFTNIEVDQHRLAIEKFHRPLWRAFQEELNIPRRQNHSRALSLPRLDAVQPQVRHHIDYFHARLNRVMDRSLPQETFHTNRWLAGVAIGVAIGLGILAIIGACYVCALRRQIHEMRRLPTSGDLRSIFAGASTSTPPEGSRPPGYPEEGAFERQRRATRPTSLNLTPIYPTYAPVPFPSDDQFRNINALQSRLQSPTSSMDLNTSFSDEAPMDNTPPLFKLSSPQSALYRRRSALSTLRRSLPERSVQFMEPCCERGCLPTEPRSGPSTPDPASQTSPVPDDEKPEEEPAPRDVDPCAPGTPPTPSQGSPEETTPDEAPPPAQAPLTTTTVPDQSNPTTLPTAKRPVTSQDIVAPPPKLPRLDQKWELPTLTVAYELPENLETYIARDEERYITPMLAPIPENRKYV